MSSLNKQGANSPDDNALSIFEYWKLLERSVNTQQSESGSYCPVVKTVAKEGGNISGTFHFRYHFITN
jgi:hypothetical protein